MEIKKEDIGVLDKILDVLCEDSIITCGLLTNRKIAKDDKQASEIIEILGEYAAYYCGKKEENDPYGYDKYKLLKDGRTLKFKADGGFKAEYERQIAEKKRQYVNESLQDEVRRLTINELRHKKRIRLWQAMSGILLAISALISILYFFKNQCI